MSNRIWPKPAACGILAVLSLLLASGCGGGGKKSGAAGTAAEQEDEVKPEEKPFIEAAKPFYTAIAAREYAKAYDLLSSHARARMSVNQFEPNPNDAAFKKNEDNPLKNVTADKFAELAGMFEKAYGKPRAVGHLSVFSTDAAVLARKSKETMGAMDSMFAIGNMPESVPANIRKASLRGQILTNLSQEDLDKAAKAEGLSVEELKKNPDFNPRFMLKVVLVEEGGDLKVGYFECLPAMFD
ncbi:MAG: hypothetical protein HY291_02240 [Planctomycetes bacterium]|nr:hypothetical protein [Planctomycetota bacterium]